MTIRCHHPGVGSMKPFEVDTGGLDRSVWPFFVKPSKKGCFFSELKDVEGKVSDEFFVLGIFAKDQNCKFKSNLYLVYCKVCTYSL